MTVPGASNSKSISLAETPEPRSGRLWNAITGLSDEDFKIWQEEGDIYAYPLPLSVLTQACLEDRVQWFRAWADMMRWMEEFELKHAELARCIRSLGHMSHVWEELAKEDGHPGYAEFGRRQADIYRKLRTDAEALFRTHGEEDFVNPKTTLMDAISTFRKQELSWFAVLTLRSRISPCV
jgi:hypothetical protein